MKAREINWRSSGTGIFTVAIGHFWWSLLGLSWANTSLRSATTASPNPCLVAMLHSKSPRIPEPRTPSNSLLDLPSVAMRFLTSALSFGRCCCEAGRSTLLAITTAGLLASPGSYRSSSSSSWVKSAEGQRPSTPAASTTKSKPDTRSTCLLCKKKCGDGGDKHEGGVGWLVDWLVGWLMCWNNVCVCVWRGRGRETRQKEPRLVFSTRRKGDDPTPEKRVPEASILVRAGDESR
mmetsp:Transcript_17032/g.34640  ORF Transcript_17032/g.34640 Transcript_17032/m.34640 type:complete len:235 (-) Transcript_17032:698-1402(-)